MLWRKVHLAAMALVLLATFAVYAPSVHYGLIWDDPLWFGRVVGKSLAELLAPMPDFQYYRPGTMLYNALFVSGNGIMAPEIVHSLQIVWHLLNVALLYTFTRALGCAGPLAVTSAALFALHPFAFQAVAWAAPMQPLVTTLLLLACLAFVRRQRGRHAAWAVVSVAAFALALLIQESAVSLSLAPLTLVVVWPLGDARGAPLRQRLRRHWLALVYPALAFLHLLLWVSAPRAGDITALGWRPPVILYLSQSIVYPLLGRPWGYDPALLPAQPTLALLGCGALAVLLWLARRKGALRRALCALAWAALGLLPSLAGLRYSYVSVGSRLAYNALPAVALLWSVALAPRRLAGRQLLGAGLSGLIVLQSLWILTDFEALWTSGAGLMRELVTVSHSRESRQVLVNFPDRYTSRRPPYPLGYWGVTLAPIVTPLSDFTTRIYGSVPETASVSAPWLDADERVDGPLVVDLRGAPATSGELYELAADGSELFLVQYDRSGAFRLKRVGQRLVPGETGNPACLATFGTAACLQGIEVWTEGTELELVLRWHILAPLQPNDTVFVHLTRPGLPVTIQADGDAWRGLIPLATWAPGDTVEDQRTLALIEELWAEGATLSAGLYNRVSGERLPANGPDGERLPMDAYMMPLSQ